MSKMNCKNKRCNGFEHIKNLCVKTLYSKNINTKFLKADNITSTNITSTNITSTNISSTDITSTNIITENIIANGNTFFKSQFYLLEVGPNKEFKSIKDAISFLQNRLIMGSVTIKVDPGIYDGFSISGFEVLNNTPIEIIGDTREIASFTFINNTNENYYTFNFTPNGLNTSVKIVDNLTNLPVNLEKLGLVVGDKIVYYNNDLSIFPKSLRFVESTVIESSSDSFLIDTSLTVINENSTITFLPNVFIRPFTQMVSTPDIFQLFYNIILVNNAKIVGMTTLESDGFSSSSNIFDLSKDSSFNSIVVMSIKWNIVSINNVLYEGFVSPCAYVNNNEQFNKSFFFSFIILGTGYNPDKSRLGPFSTNNCNVLASEIYIINAVQNQSANGILYFFNSYGILDISAVIGVEGSVGIFLSNSTFECSNILVTDSHLGILVADFSKLKSSLTNIQNCDIGLECETLSDVILNDINFINVNQDFCIKDLSRILRDGNVVVAPSC
jgi:hypothetical protein